MKVMKIAIAALSLFAALVLGGCSSSPSEEEMKQLRDLQDQVRKLEQQVQERQREKANLEKQVADQNGKVQQCQSDQEAVKKAMGGQ